MNAKERRIKFKQERVERVGKLQELDRRRSTLLDESHGDITDCAVQEALDSLQWRRNNYLAEIMEIDKSLDLIGKGLYGICLACQKPISDESLRIRPHGRMHVDCANRVVKRRSHSAELSLKYGVPVPVGS